MRIINIAILSTLLLVCSITQAQWSTVQPRFNAGLYLGSPIDDYAISTSATGAGLNMSLAIPLAPKLPFYGGLEFGYMLFGSNTVHETLNIEVTANGNVIDQIAVPLRIRTNNNVYFWNLMMRAQIPTPIVQPYVQGMLGFRYMSTNTKVFDDSNDGSWSTADNGLIVQEKQLTDYVGSVGVGGGVMIPLGRSIMLDARVDYMLGGKARYFDGNDAETWEVEFIGDPTSLDEIDGNAVRFNAEPKESFTNMYNFTLGVSFLLGNN